MDSSIILTYAIPFFLLLIIIEFSYGVIKGKNNYRLNDALTSLSLGLISRFVPLLGLGFQYVVYKYVAEYYNLKLLNLEDVWVWIFAFILYDICYYWMHRIHHEVKVFWATHVVHHHGEDFNLATALRQTSSGFLWKWVFFLPMFIIGVPPEVYVSVAGVNLVYQFWVHTEHVGRLGFLEYILITPSNHRVHHAQNDDYLDANYGGVFILCAVEWMRAARYARAIGIEPRADRRTYAANNALALGVPKLELIDGFVPNALNNLEPPDAIFIGGGLSIETFEACWMALRPLGRLVVNAVTLESEQILLKLYSKYKGDLVRIQVSRADGIGKVTGWRPSMPVTQWSLVKR